MQGELFNLGMPQAAAVNVSSLSERKSNWSDRFRITLRLDHLSIVAIFALVLYVLSFSFGVEKGKRIILREIEAQKTRQEETAKEPAEVKTEGALTAVVQPVAAKIPVTPPLQQGAIAGKFTIQVITFNQKIRAEQEVKKLKDKGYRGFIITGKKSFQVCVESFEDSGLAKEKLTRLKADGFIPKDAYIRPLKSPVTAI